MVEVIALAVGKCLNKRTQPEVVEASRPLTGPLRSSQIWWGIIQLQERTPVSPVLARRSTQLSQYQTIQGLISHLVEFKEINQEKARAWLDSCGGA